MEGVESDEEVIANDDDPLEEIDSHAQTLDQQDISNKKHKYLDRDNDSTEEEQSYTSSEAEKETSKTPSIWITIAIVWLFLFTTVIASVATTFFAYTYIKISHREASQKLLDQKIDGSNKQVESNYELLKNKLDALSTTLTFLEDKIEESLQIADSLLQYVNTLQNDQKSYSNITLYSPGYSELHPSCYAIKSDLPESTSGFYFVKSYYEQLQHVYCNMESCGDGRKGWMRVAKLDTNRCPFRFKRVAHQGYTVCALQKDGCTEIRYSVFNVKYSKVCGQVRGIMSGGPDGFTMPSDIENAKVTDVYLDGISIISSSLKHIWTFTAGYCDCNDRKPIFIENDWACDRRSRCPFKQWCVPPLWSSQRCGSDDSWFTKSMQDSVDDIIVRVCRDEDYKNEDVLLHTLELYVQ